jgi:hypothetical protein
VTIVTTEEPFAEAEDTETSKGTPQIAAISVTPVSAYDCRWRLVILWIKVAPSQLMTSGTGYANLVLGLKIPSIRRRLRAI